MIPKEKAIELVAKFTSQWFGNSIESNIWMINNIKEYGIYDQFYTAKECALIAVDEILQELECSYNGEPITTNEHKNYWQEVKQEIEKL